MIHAKGRLEAAVSTLLFRVGQANQRGCCKAGVAGPVSALLGWLFGEKITLHRTKDG